MKALLPAFACLTLLPAVTAESQTVATSYESQLSAFASRAVSTATHISGQVMLGNRNVSELDASGTRLVSDIDELLRILNSYKGSGDRFGSLMESVGAFQSYMFVTMGYEGIRGLMMPRDDEEPLPTDAEVINALDNVRDWLEPEIYDEVSVRIRSLGIGDFLDFYGQFELAEDVKEVILTEALQTAYDAISTLSLTGVQMDLSVEEFATMIVSIDARESIDGLRVDDQPTGLIVRSGSETLVRWSQARLAEYEVDADDLRSKVNSAVVLMEEIEDLLYDVAYDRDMLRVRSIVESAHHILRYNNLLRTELLRAPDFGSFFLLSIGEGDMVAALSDVYSTHAVGAPATQEVLDAIIESLRAFRIAILAMFEIVDEEPEEQPEGLAGEPLNYKGEVRLDVMNNREQNLTVRVIPIGPPMTVPVRNAAFPSVIQMQIFDEQGARIWTGVFDFVLDPQSEFAGFNAYYQAREAGTLYGRRIGAVRTFPSNFSGGRTKRDYDIPWEEEDPIGTWVINEGPLFFYESATSQGTLFEAWLILQR